MEVVCIQDGSNLMWPVLRSEMVILQRPVFEWLRSWAMPAPIGWDRLVLTDQVTGRFC